MDIKKAVYEALENAVANGYEEVLSDPAEAVAEDLLANDSELELMLGLSTAPLHTSATPEDIKLVAEYVKQVQTSYLAKRKRNES